MKKQMIALLISTVGSLAFAQVAEDLNLNLSRVDELLISQGGDPSLVPIRENPNPGAVLTEEVIHSKTIVIEDFIVKTKMTSLGYGQLTEKIIIPELASHTLFNHRNDGEEGPCLRSFRTFNLSELNHNGDLPVHIKVINRYEVNEERGICRVSMLEDVKTVVDGVEFSHVYEKPMGFRYIGDCSKK